MDGWKKRKFLTLIDSIAINVEQYETDKKTSWINHFPRLDVEDEKCRQVVNVNAISRRIEISSETKSLPLH